MDLGACSGCMSSRKKVEIFQGYQGSKSGGRFSLPSGYISIDDSNTKSGHTHILVGIFSAGVRLGTSHSGLFFDLLMRDCC